MLLCVFRSLEEVKSSNHVHITVVHNVPARKNYIFDVLFCITMSFGFEEYFICQMGTTLGLEQLVWLEPLQAWKIVHWYSIHFANRLKENLQNTFWTKPSPVVKSNDCKDGNLFNNTLFCLKKVLISLGMIISKIQRNVKVLLSRNNIWEIETFQDVRAHFASSLRGSGFQKINFLDNCDNNMEKHITRKHKQKFKQEHNYAHEMILTIMTQTEAGWRCPSSASWPCQSSRLPPTLLLALS